MTPNVFTIPAGSPFAEMLAHGIIERRGARGNPIALADVTIFLPTRRAVRSFGDSFARILSGAALLPNMIPLGDVDEDFLLFDETSDDLVLKPAIGGIRRRLLLAALVRRWYGLKRDETLSLAQAAQLARALGGFLDEAETQEADLGALDTLVPETLAEHWAEVRSFLCLLRDEWPKLLAAEDAIEPAARRRLLLDGLTRQITASSGGGLVVAAGTTGSVPATARFLAAIAQKPNGLVVLPGLDRDMDDESWNALDPSHPQYGMKELIARMGIERKDVRDWGAPSSRRAFLLRETLRPAPTTDAWRAIAERGPEDIAKDLEGLTLVETAHSGEEAASVALILREALETEGQTAALVTPDRNLARRVAAELGRWDIAIDDSAGTPLAHTPPGTFLLLLAEAVGEGFSPVPFLALLKHPICAGGMNPTEFREMARLLDRDCLRGPRPDPGLDAIRRRVANSPSAAALLPWFDRLAEILAPLCAALDENTITIPDIAAIHASTAEALAAREDQDGAARLWHGEAGQAAAQLVAALTDEARDFAAIEPASYGPLFRILSEEAAVRPSYGRHPRLAILGPLEARLQTFDLLVLGGLNEGTWPAAASADPWLSRPMRAKLGLASPERAIGLSAHDFATLAAAPRVVLSRASKVEGAPAVESRWLQRLKQLTAGLGLRGRLDDAMPYARLATLIEEPHDYAPIKRPAPRPPVAVRPRSLSVTEIETWLRDPYAIYAKHVLGLFPLEPLDAAIGPRERGTLVHRILERFLAEPADARTGADEARALAIADAVFREAGLPLSVTAIWRPQFGKALRWFLDLERARQQTILRSAVELKGRTGFAAPAGEFVLRARADRIDILKSGDAVIVDYKTGVAPSPPQVRELLAPQLPLEGLILARGGFAGLSALATSEFLYIQLRGGAEPGKIIAIDDAARIIREVETRLAERIVAFDQSQTAYYPRVMPYRRDIEGDYDHLARFREWSLVGWEADDA